MERFCYGWGGDNIERLKKQCYFWKYDLNAQAIYIDKDNINDLIQSRRFNKEVGLLHIDLDGNDYYIWKEINVIEPIIVIVEYNSLFGYERPISIPYDKSFTRNKAHYSNLYCGGVHLKVYIN